MLVLASASKTRADILKKYGIDFIQKITTADEESIKTNCPKTFVYLATKLKMKHALEDFKNDKKILCADTVVTTQNKILRKATTKEEAREILRLQSDSKTAILTCTMYHTDKLDFTDLSATIYEFDRFEEEDMENFLQSGAWEGKAGACMVEGFCKPYIKSVTGYESCAMGLTIEKLKPFL